jgi:predicted small lipoprotein YifL
MFRTLRLSLVLMLIAGGLAACGKRGPLEPPPSQKQAAEEARANESKANEGKPGEAKAGETGASPTKLGKKRIPITAPKRDLLIDAILD